MKSSQESNLAPLLGGCATQDWNGVRGFTQMGTGLRVRIAFCCFSNFSPDPSVLLTSFYVAIVSVVRSHSSLLSLLSGR